MKTFTLDEAQTLLPVLESLFERVMSAKEIVESRAAAISSQNQRIALNGGTLVRVADAARRRAEHDRALQQAKDVLTEIDQIGVQVKDLDTGLLDFPCQLGNEIVLLCWKRGEPEIGWWHSVEEGFGGRRPLDSRFSPKRKSAGKDKPERPN